MPEAFSWFTPDIPPNPTPSPSTAAVEDPPIYAELARTHLTLAPRAKPIAWPTAQQAADAAARAHADHTAMALSHSASTTAPDPAATAPPPQEATASTVPPHIRA
ncbi:hypothetical protein KUTG_09970 [Kutzneria sp. 744]|nr:hypothetical protein KUTG_09970 [Kutzneria sp. 744]